MSTPIVGLSAAVEPARWRTWETVATLLPRAYSTAVQDAGAIPLLLPPADTAAESPDLVLERIDALILAGGADVDPASYGARAHPQTNGFSSERDRFELALAHRAIERGMPVLGICRGMQMLNVAVGGTLVQHLPDLVGHERHRPAPGTFGDHEVRLEADSLAARAVGAERVEVKSHHHQGLDELGEGVVASGRSVPDDVVEAIELPEHRFALGVLWHPEEDTRSRVIGALVGQAK